MYVLFILNWLTYKNNNDFPKQMHRDVNMMLEGMHFYLENFIYW